VSCALAAAQANLPRHRRRIWSRPLVALLFFLQPVVRGWARIKWRFTLLSGQRTAQLEPVPEPAVKDLSETLAFWSDGRVDRLKFLECILAKLDRSGWIYRTDTGWTTHDVEILPGLLTRLRLTTVSEDLEQGKKNFRCRIQSDWPLPARALLALTVLAGVLLLPSMVAQYPWAWMSLMVLPMVVWLVQDEAFEHKKRLAAMVKAAANESLMVENA